MLHIANVILVLGHIGRVVIIVSAAIVVIAAAIVIIAATAAAKVLLLVAEVILVVRHLPVVAVVIVIVVVIIVVVIAAEAKRILNSLTRIIRAALIVGHFRQIAVIAECVVHIGQVAVIAADIRVQTAHRYLGRLKILHGIFTIGVRLIVSVLISLLIFSVLIGRAEDRVIHKALCRADAVVYPLARIGNSTCKGSERQRRNSSCCFSNSQASLNRRKCRRCNCALELVLCSSRCLAECTALDRIRHIARKK